MHISTYSNSMLANLDQIDFSENNLTTYTHMYVYMWLKGIKKDDIITIFKN
jgi:hypothetical protein